MVTRKPFGLNTSGREDSGRSLPIGQTIASSAMAVLAQGVGEGLLDRGGLDAELVGDLAAVDDERLGELALHLDEFPHGRVDQAAPAQRPRRQLAPPPPRSAGLPVYDVDQLTGGARVGVVG